MKHKHGGQHNHGNPTEHTGDSPEHPVHVKLVSGEDESKPQAENFNPSGGYKERPAEKPEPDWWMVIPTIVLAVFAMGSFVLLWIQLDDARKTFAKEERPYIWLDDKADVGRAASDHSFGWNVYYTNFGKSPAVGVCSEVHLATGSDASKKIFDIDHNTCGKGVEGSIIPPTKTNWNTGRTDYVPTDAEIAQWLSMQLGVIVFGRIDYSDSSGGKYVSQFCMGRQANGAVTNCPNRNHIQ